MSNIKTYYKSKSGGTNVSTNFRVKEFASKDVADKILIDIVKEFQKNKGLAVDGIIGKNTLAKLF